MVGNPYPPNLDVITAISSSNRGHKYSSVCHRCAKEELLRDAVGNDCHRTLKLQRQMVGVRGFEPLAHVEDERSFGRFIDAISKIDAIDTDTARERILAQMLKEPGDYIRSCKEEIITHRPSVRVEKIVTVGGRLAEFRRLIAKYSVDLLVMHTKDEDQSAMHGLAYPLAVELRETPLLLL